MADTSEIRADIAKAVSSALGPLPNVTVYAYWIDNAAVPAVVIDDHEHHVDDRRRINTWTLRVLLPGGPKEDAYRLGDDIVTLLTPLTVDQYGLRVTTIAPSSSLLAEQSYPGYTVNLSDDRKTLCADRPPPTPIATGAVMGTPGYYTPVGALPPDTLDDITAEPTTPWDPGTYVVTVDGNEWHWNGTAWTAGRAPAPGAVLYGFTYKLGGDETWTQTTEDPVPAPPIQIILSSAVAPPATVTAPTDWAGTLAEVRSIAGAVSIRCGPALYQIAQLAGLDGATRIMGTTIGVAGTAATVGVYSDAAATVAIYEHSATVAAAPIIPATGATAGTPGTFTPADAAPPADFAALASLTASPTSRWAVGQYVVCANSDEGWWDGDSWEPGRTPAVPATGATAGTPGTFTPAGSTPPASFAALGTLTASPATAWTTGQYVACANSDEGYWDGDSWEPGRATAPPVPPFPGTSGGFYKNWNNPLVTTVASADTADGKGFAWILVTTATPPTNAASPDVVARSPAWFTAKGVTRVRAVLTGAAESTPFDGTATDFKAVVDFIGHEPRNLNNGSTLAAGAYTITVDMFNASNTLLARYTTPLTVTA